MCHCWDKEVAVGRIANYRRLLWEIEKTNYEIRGRTWNGKDDIVPRRWRRRCVFHHMEMLARGLGGLSRVRIGASSLRYGPAGIDEVDDYLAGCVRILYTAAGIQA